LTETESDINRLGKLLEPEFPVAIQQAAVDSLLHLREPGVSEVLIRSWNGSSPTVRPILLQALLSRRIWIESLLAALESGTIATTHINIAEKQKLMKHGQAAIRERAIKLFAATSSDRQKIVKSYEAALGLQGDQGRGAILFQQNCAVCHQFTAHPQVGPDLVTVANKPVATLIESILDPNSAVEVRYVNYTALTKDDREISGIIVAEGANSITLRSPTGEETVLRKDLERLSSSGLSLMPEGFEKVLSTQDLADVIAYIRKK